MDNPEPGAEVNSKMSPEKKSAQPQKRGRPRRKKGPSAGDLGGKKYSLRSSLDGARTLRPREPAKSVEPAKNVSQPAEKSGESKRRGRKKKDAKKKSCGEFDRIRSHCRYVLKRMKYEQSFLDAYAAEGWRGQSLEKIRPEKELQRATSEITRCKVKVRDLFKKMDTLCAEGKLDEPLFDSEGEIDSEDIFCAKCGLKDVRADDDIILCDGFCDRGFHQMCLEPPLLKDQIPTDDEGWLCTGCDCKVDCIDLVNHALGTNYSIEDHWEKFFPEAAAATTGDKQHNDLDFPSDDSEDFDYNPENKGVEQFSENEESSSSDQSSERTSLSNESSPSTGHKPLDPTGLPSDDSEDDDYDPLGRNPDKNIQKEGSSSDGSDFSSDTDDLAGLVEDNESMGPDEAHSTSPLHPSKIDNDKDKHSINEVSSVAEDNRIMPVASTVMRKRGRENLNCKKVENESKGSSSGSSDEDGPLKTPKKRTNNARTSKRNAAAFNSRASKSQQCKSEGKVHLSKVGDSENTPRRTRKKLKPSTRIHAADNNILALQEGSSGSKVHSPGSKTFGALVLKRLLQSFNDNIYPSREMKENLSKKLGISVYQISRWFEKARRSMRHSSMTKKSKTEFPTKFSAKNVEQVEGCDKIHLPGGTSKIDKKNGSASTEPTSRKHKDKVKSGGTDMVNSDGKVRKGMEVDTPKRLRESFNEDIYPTRETKESLSEELGISVYQVSRWFENARRSMRRSSMTEESQTKNNNSTAAKINVVSGSAKSSAEDVEHVKHDDKIQAPGGSSENEDDKNERNSTELASRKKEDEIGSGGADMVNAGEVVMKVVEVDTPKRLRESFQQNIYPSRETKENLSKELGISVYKISRWFENARRSMRRCHSSPTKENTTKNNSPNENAIASNIDVGLVSANLGFENEQVKCGHRTQLRKGSSENKDGKNGRNSTEPSPGKNKDKVERAGTDMVSADGKLMKGMEVDTPKVGLTFDKGPNNNTKPPATRIKVRSRKTRS